MNFGWKEKYTIAKTAIGQWWNNRKATSISYSRLYPDIYNVKKKEMIKDQDILFLIYYFESNGLEHTLQHYFGLNQANFYIFDMLNDIFDLNYIIQCEVGFTYKNQNYRVRYKFPQHRDIIFPPVNQENGLYPITVRAAIWYLIPDKPGERKLLQDVTDTIIEFQGPNQDFYQDIGLTLTLSDIYESLSLPYSIWNSCTLDILDDFQETHTFSNPDELIMLT